MPTLKTDHKPSLISKIRQYSANVVWQCTCGYQVPKKNATLSGDQTYALGFHIHCPNCGKVVAQFVNPKETK